MSPESPIQIDKQSIISKAKNTFLDLYAHTSVSVPILVAAGLTEKVVAKELGVDLHVTPRSAFDIPWILLNSANLSVALPAGRAILDRYRRKS